MKIDPYTLIPLSLEMFINGGSKPIGTGTGFIVKKGHGTYFVTNWHNVTGRHRDTNEPLDKKTGYCDPDYIHVYFLTPELGVGAWKKKKIILRNNLGPIWFENTKYPNVDVVVIPLARTTDVDFHYINLDEPYIGLAIYPSKAVSILGFPYGLTSGGMFPIWKKGHIASEPHYPIYKKPIFLIDATTRPGMSGSPVILRESGNCEFENNSIVQGNFVKFLGIYSGRLNDDAEIGIVWKPEAIEGAIENCQNRTQPSTYILQPVDVFTNG